VSLFKELRDEDTTMRPELELDETDIGGEDGATCISNIGIGIGNGMSSLSV
jgi:hypothetical protein